MQNWPRIDGSVGQPSSHWNLKDQTQLFGNDASQKIFPLKCYYARWLLLSRSPSWCVTSGFQSRVLILRLSWAVCGTRRDEEKTMSNFKLLSWSQMPKTYLFWTSSGWYVIKEKHDIRPILLAIEQNDYNRPMHEATELICLGLGAYFTLRMSSSDPFLRPPFISVCVCQEPPGHGAYQGPPGPLRVPIAEPMANGTSHTPEMTNNGAHSHPASGEYALAERHPAQCLSIWTVW